jgi:hypothetical protein
MLSSPDRQRTFLLNLLCSSHGVVNRAVEAESKPRHLPRPPDRNILCDIDAGKSSTEHVFTSSLDMEAFRRSAEEEIQEIFHRHGGETRADERGREPQNAGGRGTERIERKEGDQRVELG